MNIKHLFPVAVLATIIACNGTTQKTEETSGDEVYAATTSTTCTAPSSWFQQVGGTRHTPAPQEGPNSPFANNATVTNCDFHKWSWQKFLWLTNDVNGQPLFLDSLTEVSSSGQIVDHSNGIILTSVAQASGTNDTLRTPDYTGGKPPSTTVYSGIFVNDLLYNTMTTYAPIAKDNPDSVKHMTFPVGALELKTTWIDTGGLADTNGYFITKGIVDGTTTRVALLGIHVVGIVENHPEFVWATFEHDGLVPAYDWAQATPTTDAPVTSSTDYPFFNKAETASITNITTNGNTGSINNGTDVFYVYQYGTPVEKVASGSGSTKEFMATSQNGSENFNNIDSINTSVKSQLTGVWNNYFYNGSIWINTEGYVGTTAQAELLDSLSYHMSDSDTGDLTRGSVACYNITMETYVQVGFGTSSIHAVGVDSLANCLSCHNTSSGNNLSPLYISHVFTGYEASLTGLNAKEIKQQHVDEIVSHFNLRKQEAKK